MDIVIRHAIPKDFTTVRRIDPHSKYIDPEKIRTKMQSHEIILAFDGKKPVGIIKFSYFWATRPYMDLIWVSEDYRGMGIGTQLLAYLEHYLVGEGYTYLYTSSEEDELTPQTWHQRHGFQKCGVLSAINLPHDTTSEVFFYKHIATTHPEEEHLKTYVILPQEGKS